MTKAQPESRSSYPGEPPATFRRRIHASPIPENAARPTHPVAAGNRNYLAARLAGPRSRGSRTAEHRADPGGRPGLRRSRLLRPKANRDAEYRSPGGRRSTIYAVLRRLHGVCSVALRADDRAEYRTLLYSRQFQPQPARQRRHGGPSAQAGRLRNGPVRQVGARSGGQRRRADASGFRAVLRLSRPGARAQLLSRLPDFRRIARAAAERRPRTGPLRFGSGVQKGAIQCRPDPRSGAGVSRRAQVRPVLSRVRIDSAARQQRIAPERDGDPGLWALSQQGLARSGKRSGRDDQSARLGRGADSGPAARAGPRRPHDCALHLGQWRAQRRWARSAVPQRYGPAAGAQAGSLRRGHPRAARGPLARPYPGGNRVFARRLFR